MFCLKHLAELDCYGRGGLSKPRCTRDGCDGEHTPDLHMLMSGGDAKVSLVAGDEDEESFGVAEEYENECEYEWEYEDGGLWVGTVSAAADLEGSGEGRSEEEGADESCEREGDFQANEGVEEEAVGDGWWDVRSESPELEDTGVNTLLAGVLHRPPHGPPRPWRPAAGEQWTEEGQGTAAEQRWEEAGHRARLRGATDGGLVSEDDDEEQLGGWRLELFEPP
jgi:hypothetical protein